VTLVILTRGEPMRASVGIQHKIAEGSLSSLQRAYAGFPAFDAPAAHSAENNGIAAYFRPGS
jgi:hypothetical protein